MTRIHNPFVSGDHYTTPERPLGLLARSMPSLSFYPRAIATVWRSSLMARAGRYDTAAWAGASLEIVAHLEAVGCRLQVTGLDQLDRLDQPTIFIGNHMSTLETFVLPSIITTRAGQLTFVVKRSLIDYPIFGHVMRSRNPIVVDRANPRDDLKAVMEQGAERLAQGYSIVIFPQHTRTVQFDPAQFNSIGVKLAARTGAQVVPIALQTWAWSPGKRLKDYGPIIPSRTVHIAFGGPFTVEGKGQAEQQRIVDFIQSHLGQWQKEGADF